GPGGRRRPDAPHGAARGPRARQHLAHLFPAASEVFEAPLLDLERNQLDVDAGEVVGQRSPSARLLALVRPDPLRRDELQGPVLREQRLEEGQRELPIVRGDAFGLLAQEPLLELRVVFPQLLVEEAAARGPEPDDLHTRGAAIGEDEEAAGARVFAEALASGEGQAVEAAAEVDRLGAEEDADMGGDHRGASRAVRTACRRSVVTDEASRSR